MATSKASSSKVSSVVSSAINQKNPYIPPTTKYYQTGSSMPKPQQAVSMNVPAPKTTSTTTSTKTTSSKPYTGGGGSSSSQPQSVMQPQSIMPPTETKPTVQIVVSEATGKTQAPTNYGGYTKPKPSAMAVVQEALGYPGIVNPEKPKIQLSSIPGESQIEEKYIAPVEEFFVPGLKESRLRDMSSSQIAQQKQQDEARSKEMAQQLYVLPAIAIGKSQRAEKEIQAGYERESTAATSTLWANPRYSALKTTQKDVDKAVAEKQALQERYNVYSKERFNYWQEQVYGGVSVTEAQNVYGEETKSYASQLDKSFYEKYPFAKMSELDYNVLKSEYLTKAGEANKKIADYYNVQSELSQKQINFEYGQASKSSSKAYETKAQGISDAFMGAKWSTLSNAPGGLVGGVKAVFAETKATREAIAKEESALATDKFSWLGVTSDTNLIFKGYNGDKFPLVGGIVAVQGSKSLLSNYFVPIVGGAASMIVRAPTFFAKVGIAATAPLTPLDVRQQRMQEVGQFWSENTLGLYQSFSLKPIQTAGTIGLGFILGKGLEKPTNIALAKGMEFKESIWPTKYDIRSMDAAEVASLAKQGISVSKSEGVRYFEVSNKFGTRMYEAYPQIWTESVAAKMPKETLDVMKTLQQTNPTITVGGGGYTLREITPGVKTIAPINVDVGLELTSINKGKAGRIESLGTVVQRVPGQLGKPDVDIFQPIKILTKETGSLGAQRSFASITSTYKGVTTKATGAFPNFKLDLSGIPVPTETILTEPLKVSGGYTYESKYGNTFMASTGKVPKEVLMYAWKGEKTSLISPKITYTQGADLMNYMAQGKLNVKMGKLTSELSAINTFYDWTKTNAPQLTMGQISKRFDVTGTGLMKRGQLTENVLYGRRPIAPSEGFTTSFKTTSIQTPTTPDYLFTRPKTAEVSYTSPGITKRVSGVEFLNKMVEEGKVKLRFVKNTEGYLGRSINTYTKADNTLVGREILIDARFGSNENLYKYNKGKTKVTGKVSYEDVINHEIIHSFKQSYDFKPILENKISTYNQPVEIHARVEGAIRGVTGYKIRQELINYDTSWMSGRKITREPKVTPAITKEVPVSYLSQDLLASQAIRETFYKNYYKSSGRPEFANISLYKEALRKTTPGSRTTIGYMGSVGFGGEVLKNFFKGIEEGNPNYRFVKPTPRGYYYAKNIYETPEPMLIKGASAKTKLLGQAADVEVPTSILYGRRGRTGAITMLSESDLRYRYLWEQVDQDLGGGLVQKQGQVMRPVGIEIYQEMAKEAAVSSISSVIRQQQFVGKVTQMELSNPYTKFGNVIVPVGFGQLRYNTLNRYRYAPNTGLNLDLRYTQNFKSPKLVMRPITEQIARPVLAQIPVNAQSLKKVQVQELKLNLKQLTIQDLAITEVLFPPINIMPTGRPPPPIKIPLIFPDIPAFGGGAGKSAGAYTGARRKFRYTPSLVAQEFRIKASKGVSRRAMKATFTGIEVRPLI